MRSNAAQNLSAEEHFTRDLAFKNESGKRHDGLDEEGVRKNKSGKRKKL